MGGPKGKQLLPSLPASGDHHTPSQEACPTGSLPISAPLPRNGGGAGPGGEECIAYHTVLEKVPSYWEKLTWAPTPASGHLPLPGSRTHPPRPPEGPHSLQGMQGPATAT